MANKTLDWAERRRLELDQDRGPQQRSPPIIADSRVEAEPTHLLETRPDPFAPGNPRFAYLTRSHD